LRQLGLVRQHGPPTLRDLLDTHGAFILQALRQRQLLAGIPQRRLGRLDISLMLRDLLRPGLAQQLGELGLVHLQRRSPLGQLRLQGAIIQFEECLTRLHGIPDLDEHLGHDAGHVGPDGDVLRAGLDDA
jgi:hypothetical protein